MSKQYQNGDTAYITVSHTTYTLATDTWALADPDATFPKITIIDPAGATKVDATSMTKKATGKFEHLYTLPAASTGVWRGYVDVENGSNPDRSHFSWIVKE